jgi:hypothetical protein
MKSLTVLPFLTAVLMAQVPAKVFTFNRADAEHCKVIVIDGKPLLESTVEGTSVAIAMPVNRGNGEFLVFVAISRVAPGTIHIDPRGVYGLYSDAAHSRFTFFDKAAEMDSRIHGQPGDSALSASNAQLNPGSMRPGQAMGPGPGGLPPGSPGDSGQNAGAARSGATAVPAYLHQSKLKQGGKLAGWIALHQPKGVTLDAGSTGMLDEINIPVNGIVFRF